MPCVFGSVETITLGRGTCLTKPLIFEWQQYQSGLVELHDFYFSVYQDDRNMIDVNYKRHSELTPAALKPYSSYIIWQQS